MAPTKGNGTVTWKGFLPVAGIFVVVAVAIGGAFWTEVGTHVGKREMDAHIKQHVQERLELLDWHKKVDAWHEKFDGKLEAIRGGQ